MTIVNSGLKRLIKVEYPEINKGCLDIYKITFWGVLLENVETNEHERVQFRVKCCIMMLCQHVQVGGKFK